MAIFLDTASRDDLQRALDAALPVAGVTTNPTLLRKEPGHAADVIAGLLELTREVFYQPTGIDDPLPEGATPKLPMSAEFLPRARDYDSVFAFTAVYSPAQAVVACQIYRTRWLIPYVDRARRQLGDGLELVRSLRSVCDAHGGRTRILAASLKSPEQVVAAMQAGAQDVTLPLGVLEAMVHHEFTTQALADFAG